MDRTAAWREGNDQEFNHWPTETLRTGAQNGRSLWMQACSPNLRHWLSLILQISLFYVPHIIQYMSSHISWLEGSPQKAVKLACMLDCFGTLAVLHPCICLNTRSRHSLDASKCMSEWGHDVKPSTYAWGYHHRNIYIYRLHGFEWIWIEKIEYDNMDTETQHRDFLSLNVELLCHDADGEAISHLLPLVVSSWVQYPAIVPCHVTQFQSIVLLCPIRGSNGRL